MSQTEPRFTPRQGQYLAFIHAYTCVNARPPTVHQMVLSLERAGLIKRTPGTARSIRLIIPPESLPALQKPNANSS